MSNAVFPTLPGQAWPRGKVARHSTLVHRAGPRRFALGRQMYPTYLYRINYGYLRQADFETLVGFFNNRRGRLDDFLFDDRDDRSVTNQVFGVGDGSSTSFQLARTLGGFTEPVRDFNSVPALRIQDWQGDWPLYTVSRGNALRWSEAFMDAVWVMGNASKSTSAVAAPDGVGTAFSITENTANSTHYISQVVTTFVSGAGYTFSVFLKAGGRDQAMVRFIEGSAFATTAYVVVNLTTGAITLTSGASASSIQALPGGWYRVTVTAVASGTGSSTVAVMLMTGGNNTYLGNGSSGLYAWGAQVDGFGPVNRYIRSQGTPASVIDYTLGAYGAVTTGFAPVGGATLTWTGTYYWRVAFTHDERDFDEFVRQLRTTKTVEFETFTP